LLHHKPKHKTLSNGGESETRVDVPWFLITGPSNQPVSERLAREIDCEGALQDAAARARCDTELICCVRLARQNGRPAIDRVYPLRIVASPSRSLMAQTSALEQEPLPCALIGCGALGAKLGEFLVREGIAQLTLVDPDVLEPHNLARHTLGRSSLGLPKAKELKQHLERIVGQEHDFSCRARTMRIDELDDKTLSEALGNQPHWVIDATADARAARRLTLSGQPHPVIRVELTDAGRLGLLAVEGVKRNPRLDDLQATLYQTALSRPEIAAWLQRDAGLAPVMVGVGCASATMQMPDSRVALHAAAFMPSINARIVGKEVYGGGLGINHLDAYGQPIGWTWVDVPPFESIRVEVSDPSLEPWELRVHPDALKAIEAAARAARPREAGGYLYGRFDVGARTLTVVEAVALQSLEATATKLVLPPAGRSPREREIIERCGTSLRCLGPWHSHPNRDASWSARDRSQAEEFARANRKSLHAQNALWVAGYVALHVVAFMSLATQGSLDPETIKETISEIWSTEGAMAAIVIGVSIVLNGLLSGNMKAILVFWRFRHPLPGHRAFTLLGPKDPRVDIMVLEAQIGPLPPLPPHQRSGSAHAPVFVDPARCALSGRCRSKTHRWV